MNGITISIPIDQHFAYKYVVGWGNNCYLVKNILKKRSQWMQADLQYNLIWKNLPITKIQNTSKEPISPPNEIINHIWTAVIDKKIIRTFPKLAELASYKQKFMQPKRNRVEGNLKQFSKQDLSKEYKYFGLHLVSKSYLCKYQQDCRVLNPFKIRIYNHLENNYHLSNKKALFKNLKQYYSLINEKVFSVVPLTYHIKGGLLDNEFQAFVRDFKSRDYAIKREKTKAKIESRAPEIAKHNIWIIKPGEFTNRGIGIMVSSDLQEISKVIADHSLGQENYTHTYIVQEYITNPFLVNKRKFDIRAYVLVTNINGNIIAYYYKEGYIRTSGKEWTIDQLHDRTIHLTNDAVQKYDPNYGKFELGNKLSYEDFQRYLDTKHAHRKLQFNEQIIPQIKKIMRDTIKATYLKLDPYRRQFCFELFGYDFIIDDNFKVWLIEVNTNPCLELSCPYLAKLIPNMLDNVFKIVLDPFFPVSLNRMNKNTGEKVQLTENKFELIFNQYIDGEILKDMEIFYQNESSDNESEEQDACLDGSNQPKQSQKGNLDKKDQNKVQSESSSSKKNLDLQKKD